MKKFIAATLFLSTYYTFAQTPSESSGIDQQAREQLTTVMIEVQTCMSKIDPTAMQSLETSTVQAEKEIQSLCQAGKHDEALQKAIAFGQSMLASAVMKDFQACGKILDDAVVGMPPSVQQELPKLGEIPYSDPDADYSNKNVCDDFSGRN